ncbi:MAG: response regulator [Candidatus Omnitrophota bacterium]
MHKKKILVIDDEEAFTEVVKFNLEETGKYEVRVENKGARGFDAAKEFRPDLILLDIIMPGMGGDKVAFQLKNSEDTKNIPVILLTAIVTKEEEAGAGGVLSGYHVIAKPVDLEKLIAAVEELCP